MLFASMNAVFAPIRTNKRSSLEFFPRLPDGPTVSPSHRLIDLLEKFSSTPCEEQERERRKKLIR